MALGGTGHYTLGGLGAPSHNLLVRIVLLSVGAGALEELGIDLQVLIALLVEESHWIRAYVLHFLAPCVI